MKIGQEDRDLFEKSCRYILDQERMRLGIGTLGEKTVHAVLKNYLVPRQECHEQKCEGFVADILLEGEIMEIQTAGFNKLRRKLEVFLPEYEVTVVYPIPETKWLLWIDQETGELSGKRKSPKKGSYYQVFSELYRIKMFLKDPNLHFRLILMDMEEYRLLNGWSSDRKKGSTRFDRIPVTINSECMINSAQDYQILIPEKLPQSFTSGEFGKAAGISRQKAQTALNILNHMEAVFKVGKQGNTILYERAGSN